MHNACRVMKVDQATDEISDLSTSFEKTMLELAEEEGATLESEPVDGKVISSRVRSWLETLDCPEAERDPVAKEQRNTAGESHEDVGLDGEEPEEVVLPDKFGYRHVLFNSEAYKAVLARMTRQVSLTSLTESDAMVQVRSFILNALPSQLHVSRRLESKVFTAMLRVPWHPAEFIRQQFPDSETGPDDLLGRVITLTGHMSNAQALPCSDYLQQTWPESGSYILTAMAEAIRTGEGTASMCASCFWHQHVFVLLTPCLKRHYLSGLRSRRCRMMMMIHLFDYMPGGRLISSRKLPRFFRGLPLLCSLVLMTT